MVETKKERTRRLQREWYARNPEKAKLKWQRRYQKDPEKEKARRKKYLEENREKVAARKKAARSTPEAKEKERIRRAEYYRKNKEKEQAKNAEWRANNPDMVKAGSLRAATDPSQIERIKKYRKRRYLDNKDELMAKWKEWRDRNKEVLKQRRKERIASDPEHYKKHWQWVKSHPPTRMALAARARVRDLVIRGRMPRQRPATIIDLIGCTGPDLVRHLESLFTEGMSWDNYGKDGWHVDHKRPCASFDLSDPDQKRQCFHYTNLQPLWWWDNIAKSDKYEPEVAANTG